MAGDMYPGTPQHQALLKGIVEHYATDPRIRAVIVFGSLSRGNWDTDSDIDLDVVIGDDVNLDVETELQALGDALLTTGEKTALAFAVGPDEGEMVFESLLQLSVRYHPLATTKPAIVDSMRLLTGELDAARIAAAGLANQIDDRPELRLQLDKLLRYVAATDVAVRQQELWLAIELLGRMRGLYLDIFTQARGGERSFYFFATAADSQLQEKVGRALPQFNQDSIRRCLLAFIELLQQDGDALTAGRQPLSATDRRLLDRVRHNQGG
jgi:predicted nucleotidyltransferase